MTHSANNLRAALRLGMVLAVLALSPAIALADDLMDYGGDYTDAAVVPSEPFRRPIASASATLRTRRWP